MKWHTKLRLLMALMALMALTAACGEDPGAKQSDDEYCRTTYVSTWDGRQVKPLWCPE